MEGHHLAYMLSKKYKKVFKLKTPETGLYQGVNAPSIDETVFDEKTNTNKPAPQFNILTAAADERKKAAYKDLDKAMKATMGKATGTDKESKKREREEIEDEKFESIKSFNLGMWLSIGVLAATVVGAVLNFGRSKKNWKGVKPTAGIIRKANKAL